MKATTSVSVLLVALLAAATAHASDVDILFPLRGLFFAWILLAVLAPLLPLAPVAGVAGLYALFIEGRKALGASTLLLTASTIGAAVILFSNREPEHEVAAIATIVTIAVTLPAAWILLARGMIRSWPKAKTAKAIMMGVILWGGFLAGEVALFNAATAIPPPILDAGYAARRCNGLSYACGPYATVNVDTDAQMDACVAAFPVCQTSQPWNETADCCPATCLAAYAEERAFPSPAQMALRVAFNTHHECHPGVQAADRARGYQPPPIPGRKTTPRP